MRFQHGIEVERHLQWAGQQLAQHRIAAIMLGKIVHEEEACAVVLQILVGVIGPAA